MLYPEILLFCAIGAFSIQNSVFDIYVMAIFGVIGYVFQKLRCEPAPLLLGFVLGPMMEENLRRAMVLSRGDPMVFLTRPLSATLLLMALVLLAAIAAPSLRRKREQVFKEEEAR